MINTKDTKPKKKQLKFIERMLLTHARKELVKLNRSTDEQFIKRAAGFNKFKSMFRLPLSAVRKRFQTERRVIEELGKGVERKQRRLQKSIAVARERIRKTRGKKHIRLRKKLMLMKERLNAVEERREILTEKLNAVDEEISKVSIAINSSESYYTSLLRSSELCIAEDDNLSKAIRNLTSLNRILSNAGKGLILSGTLAWVGILVHSALKTGNSIPSFSPSFSYAGLGASGLLLTGLALIALRNVLKKKRKRILAQKTISLVETNNIVIPRPVLTWAHRKDRVRLRAVAERLRELKNTASAKLNATIAKVLKVIDEYSSTYAKLSELSFLCDPGRGVLPVKELVIAEHRERWDVISTGHIDVASASKMSEDVWDAVFPKPIMIDIVFATTNSLIIRYRFVKNERRSITKDPFTVVKVRLETLPKSVRERGIKRLIFVNESEECPVIIKELQ